MQKWGKIKIELSQTWPKLQKGIRPSWSLIWESKKRRREEKEKKKRKKTRKVWKLGICLETICVWMTMIFYEILWMY